MTSVKLLSGCRLYDTYVVMCIVWKTLKPKIEAISKKEKPYFDPARKRSKLQISQARKRIRKQHVGQLSQATADMHESHQLFFVNGIIFCQICGRWSHRRTMLLSNECSPIPEGQGQKMRHIPSNSNDHIIIPPSSLSWMPLGSLPENQDLH